MAANRWQAKDVVNSNINHHRDLVQESQLMMPSMTRQTTDPAMERSRNIEQQGESSKIPDALSMPLGMPTMTRQTTDPAMEVVLERRMREPVKPRHFSGAGIDGLVRN